MRDIEAFDPFGRFREAPARIRALRRSLSSWASTRGNRCTNECFAFFSTSSRKACFWPRCGFRISTRCPGGIREDFLEQRAILEIHGHVDEARQIGCIEIKLLQQRRQKFGGIEFLEILPSRNRDGRQRARRASGRDSRRPAAVRHTRRARPYRHPARRRFSGALPFRLSVRRRSRYPAASSYRSSPEAVAMRSFRLRERSLRRPFEE